jgi:hypothetical protein
MAKTVHLFSPVTGTHVFTARNASGQWWNGSAFETYNASNIATYAIAATVTGGGWYKAILDDAATTWDLRLRVGGSLATTDPTVDVGGVADANVAVPTEAQIAAEILATTNGSATVGTQLARLDAPVSTAGSTSPKDLSEVL